jgi:hypothetical protein
LHDLGTSTAAAAGVPATSLTSDFSSLLFSLSFALPTSNFGNFATSSQRDPIYDQEPARRRPM